MQPRNMFLNYEQRSDVKINVVKSIKRERVHMYVVVERKKWLKVCTS